MKILREIIEYKEMIYMLVKRNLRGRYKKSVLGFAWTFLNPLLQLIIYTIVFSVILKSNIKNYYLFLFVALIPWLAMSGSIIDGSMCIITESNLVTKVYFPRLIIPLVSTLNNFINMLLCLIVVFLACFFTIGINFKLIILLIPIIFIEFILALGISLIVSAVTVFFRDLQHILTIVIMAWQFLTPIMYSIDMVPDNIKMFFYINPMTTIITAYRDVLYYKIMPEFYTVTCSFIISIVILSIGVFIFNKCEKKFAEVL